MERQDIHIEQEIHVYHEEKQLQNRKLFVCFCSDSVTARSTVVRLVLQFVEFIGISGLGWLIDFGCYSFMSYLTDWNVGICNAISAIPAITFVFFVSTIRTFKQRKSAVPLWGKYAIYVGYQII